MKVAQTQLQSARKSFTVLCEPEKYKISLELFADKEIEAGLPIDKFRAFIRSHTTRLENVLKNENSIVKKELIRQRKAIMRKATELYKGLQRGALGMPQKQSLSR